LLSDRSGEVPSEEEHKNVLTCRETLHSLYIEEKGLDELIAKYRADLAVLKADVYVCVLRRPSAVSGDYRHPYTHDSPWNVVLTVLCLSRNSFLLHDEIQAVEEYLDQTVLAIRAPQGTRLEVVNPYTEAVRYVLLTIM
jgi:hypothetical protein